MLRTWCLSILILSIGITGFAEEKVGSKKAKVTSGRKPASENEPTVQLAIDKFKRELRAASNSSERIGIVKKFRIRLWNPEPADESKTGDLCDLGTDDQKISCDLFKSHLIDFIEPDLGYSPDNIKNSCVAIRDKWKVFYRAEGTEKKYRWYVDSAFVFSQMCSEPFE